MDDIVWKPPGRLRSWPAEQLAQLRALILEGWPRSDIAAELRVTKNAVIGMAWRMGLSAPRVPAAKPRNRRGRVRKPWKSKRPKGRGIMQAIEDAGNAQQENAINIPEIILPPCDFMHLDYTTCRWPLWDHVARVPFDEQYYCGAPTIGQGQPYCGEHCRMAYTRSHGPGISRWR